MKDDDELQHGEEHANVLIPLTLSAACSYGTVLTSDDRSVSFIFLRSLVPGLLVVEAWRCIVPEVEMS
jgi:hypothetical protein